MNEILLYGVIGEDVMPADIKSQLALADRDEELVVRIDSPGGSVFHGLSLYQAFADYDGPKRAVVESSAFSIASYIAMAFDRVEMADNGYMMIHNPASGGDGDDEQKLKDAALLAKLKQSMIAAYSGRTGIPADEIQSMMKAETYLNAEESVGMGFASGVLGKSVKSRVVAMSVQMPQAVLKSLRSDGTSGDPPEPRELPMAEKNEPVAATVADIKSAFPQAKSDFIVRCLERQMPIASVAAAAAEELMSENEDLKAKVAALEKEMEEANAKAMEEEEEAKAMEEEDEEAKAKAKGASPVARSTTSPKSDASEQWSAAVAKFSSQGLPKSRAVQMANKRNPGLREAMLAEVNAR